MALQVGVFGFNPATTTRQKVTANSYHTQQRFKIGLILAAQFAHWTIMLQSGSMRHHQLVATAMSPRVNPA